MKRQLPTILLLACAVAFVFGTLELFKLRYDVGDVYPKYSSLRADPLGTMALYESLDKLPGVFVSRDFSTVNRLPEDKNVTYLHLAASRHEWTALPEDLFREIDQFLARGGRLVITLFPDPTGYTPLPSLEKRNRELTEEKKSKDGNTKDEKEPAEKKPVGNPPVEKVPLEKESDPRKSDDKPEPPAPGEKKSTKLKLKEASYVLVSERWGVDFKIIDLKQGVDGVYESARVVNASDLPLPRALDWHSGVVLAELNKAWQTIYARGTNAVVAERKFGRGSVVIATDTYFASNEAMQKDRQTQLLAWLIGPGHDVVFDEAHLGVAEGSNTATLMRKYRLHGLILGLLLLAGLFIWKNSVSLVPRRDETTEDHITGKTASAGFVNLLRRSISPRELLAVCFAEWKKSVAQTGKYSAARVQQAEAAFRAENSVPAQELNPLRAYQAIHAVLQRRHAEPEKPAAPQPAVIAEPGPRPAPEPDPTQPK